jgi:dihydroorotase
LKILIKNGRVIDPANKIDDQIDILVDKNVISKVTNNISEAEASGEDDLIIDANGCYVCPGLIDLRVHFREPGFEHKETIRTGARAAARGGFTTVCTMPKTKPAIDSEERVREAIEKAKDVTDINVLPVGAITASDEGQYLTDFDGMKRAGAVAVCEDGNSIMDARVARQALKQAAEVDIPVFAHCEDRNLMARGVMNAGDRAKELGLYGILDAVEETMVARDILLAKDTKAKLHICHVSTKTAVDLITNNEFDVQTGAYVIEEQDVNLNVDEHITLDLKNVPASISEEELMLWLRNAIGDKGLIRVLVENNDFQSLDMKVKEQLMKKAARRS